MESKIYINSRLMRVSGDDTQHLLDLGNRYTAKRLVLNSFSVDNVFKNFEEPYNDFSFAYRMDNGAEGIVNIYMDNFVTQPQFLTWFNS